MVNGKIYGIDGKNPEEAEYVVKTSNTEISMKKSLKDFIEGLLENDDFVLKWYDIFIDRQKKNFNNIINFIDPNTGSVEKYEFEAIKEQ